MKPQKHILKYEEVGIKDVGLVGGKNASLGEMIRTLKAKGVPVPSGFVVTASAYFYFLEKTGLDKFIKTTLKGLEHEESERSPAPRARSSATLSCTRNFRKTLPRKSCRATTNLKSVTARTRMWRCVLRQQRKTCRARPSRASRKAISASAGQQRSSRPRAPRWRRSSPTARSPIAQDRGFDHLKIALSAGVQKMVRSDRACSGVMFTLDTESGFPNIVLINGSWGLGEMIVKGEVTPDEFIVWKEGLATRRCASDHRKEARRETAQDDLSPWQRR